VEVTGVLELLAELSVAVLGFSGVVVVLGRRASGDWTEIDRVRFRGMVRFAALALILSLLPFPFRSAGWSEPAVWGWSSGIGTPLCAFLFVFYGQVRRVVPWSNPAVSKFGLIYALSAIVAGTILLALNATGIVFRHTATPYLVATLLLFGASVTAFFRLLEAAITGARRAVEETAAPDDPQTANE
jgi:hypothetical protein